jgi:hypothetical protein
MEPDPPGSLPRPFSPGAGGAPRSLPAAPPVRCRRRPTLPSAGSAPSRSLRRPHPSPRRPFCVQKDVIYEPLMNTKGGTHRIQRGRARNKFPASAPAGRPRDGSVAPLSRRPALQVGTPGAVRFSQGDGKSRSERWGARS